MHASGLSSHKRRRWRRQQPVFRPRVGQFSGRANNFKRGRITRHSGNRGKEGRGDGFSVSLLLLLLFSFFFYHPRTTRSFITREEKAARLRENIKLLGLLEFFKSVKYKRHSTFEDARRKIVPDNRDRYDGVYVVYMGNNTRDRSRSSSQSKLRA